MATVGKLLVELSADVARLQADMNRATSMVERGAASMSTAAGMATAALGAIGVGVSVGALVSQFQTAVTALADLDDAAEKSGASVEDLSAIFNTLAPTGATLEQITDLTGKLAKAMREAGTAGSEQAQAFAALGVQVKDANGNYRSTGTVLEEVARALAGYRDGANKTVLAQQLLGKTGAEQLPLLKDLATRTREASTVTSEQAAAAETLANNIRTLNHQFTLMAQDVAAAVVPQLSDLLSKLRSIAAISGNPIKWAQYLFGDSSDINAKITETEADITRLQGLIDGSIKPDRGANFRGSEPPIMRWFREAIGDDADMKAARDRLMQLQRDLQEMKAVRETQRRLGVATAQRPPTQRELMYGGSGYGDLPDAPSTGDGPKPGPTREAREQRSEAERLLQTLTTQLERTRELSVEQQTLAAIGRGEIGGLNPVLEQQILLVAAQIDKARERQAAEKSLADQLRADAAAEIADYEALRKLSNDARLSTEREVDAIRSMVDPTRELYAQMDRVKTLVASGLLPQDVGNARLMQLLGEIDRILGNLPGSVTPAKNAIEELGFEFASAFENAVIGGEKVSDMLQGLGEDVARFLLRQQITKPVLDLLGGTFDSAKQGGTIVGMLMSMIPGRAKGGPVDRGAPYWVGEEGRPELFVPREAGTIVPLDQVRKAATGRSEAPQVGRIELDAPRIEMPQLEAPPASVPDELVQALQGAREAAPLARGDDMGSLVRDLLDQVQASAARAIAAPDQPYGDIERAGGYSLTRPEALASEPVAADTRAPSGAPQIAIHQTITYGGNDPAAAMRFAERIKADTIRAYREAQERGATA